MQVHSWDCCGHLDQRKASQHPLCLAQVASPCMPWSTSPSHCPGVSPHPVPPTNTAEDWGQNLAGGISSWPGSGIFPTLSTFSPCLDPPSSPEPGLQLGWPGYNFCSPGTKGILSLRISSLWKSAWGGGAVPWRGDPHPARAGSWTRRAPPSPAGPSVAFRKRSGWRATSFRGAALSRGRGPRWVRTGHRQRKTLSRLAQVRSSRRLSGTGSGRGGFAPAPPVSAPRPPGAGRDELCIARGCRLLSSRLDEGGKEREREGGRERGWENAGGGQGASDTPAGRRGGGAERSGERRWQVRGEPRQERGPGAAEPWRERGPGSASPAGPLCRGGGGARRHRPGT